MIIEIGTSGNNKKQNNMANNHKQKKRRGSKYKGLPKGVPSYRKGSIGHKLWSMFRYDCRALPLYLDE